MSALIAQIRAYEQQAAIIEPDAEQRAVLLDKVTTYTEAFLERIKDRPAYVNTDERGRGIFASPIAEQGMAMDAVLALYQSQVEEQGLSPVSGRFLAYIPPCSMYYAALGDYIAAITNEYVGDYANCPGAVHLENQLLDWMAGLAGYPDNAKGTLASGGSLATLTCIVTAREAFRLKARDYEKAVVYMTGITHHAVIKGLHIAGMGECVQVNVPMDSAFRMCPDALAEMIDADRRRGLMPWMVVASAGTTDVGSVDPLAALGAVAKRHELWYHIDAAYGGFFVLSDLVKDKLADMALSDSVVMNPHKALHTPFGLGAALVKDGELLYQAHFCTANYMQDSFYNKDEVSPADVGPELTRHFRALRLWLPLKLIGVAPFRAMLSEKLLLARYAYEQIKAMPGMETGPPPALSIFVFRYVAVADADGFNKKLLEAIRADGTILLSSTLLGGHYMIRFAVLSYRTHKETIDLAIAVIDRLVATLLADDQ